MGNILDIILTDSPDLVSEHIVHKREDNLHSDHYLISLYLTSNSVSVYSAPSDPSYNFLRADWAGLIDFLNDIDFSHCFSYPDINSIWMEIKGIIVMARNRYVPRVHAKRSQLPKWFTPSLHHLLKVTGYRQPKGTWFTQQLFLSKLLLLVSHACSRV